MRRYFKLKSATKLALFSTAVIVVAMLVLYALLSYAFEDQLRILRAAPGALSESPANTLQFLLIPIFFVVPVSYVISALIIDRVLNPVRVMIEKVKSVGDRSFNSKLFLDTSEDELTEYALAFNQMSSKISEYIERQKQFISDASHELVTPVTVIVGHADMLLRWGKDEPDTLASGLATIKTEALAMNELIENLLFFARSDNSRIAYDRKECDLSALINECIGEQRLLYPDFEILCDNFDAPRIYADADAIRRVLRILITNSVKYSPDSKTISVTLEHDGRNIRLSVTDRGIGIDAKYLTKIFDRFYRVDDSRARETGGTGLGLAIAREILDAHGYSIAAQSAPGEGTTMTITLSAAKPSSNLHKRTLTSS